MSRQIDLDSKLSAEDRDYLLARGRRHLVLQNDRRFASAAKSTPAPQESNAVDNEWAEQVNELTVAELRDELSNRGLDTKGNQETLRKRLIEAGPEA